MDEGNLGADVVVFPNSVEQLSQIIRYCSDKQISVVAHGGRTGISGAAVSSPGQLIIQTAQLNQILDLDLVGETATVECGVTLQQLQEAVAEHGSGVGVDLAARGSATIGGMVSTNAGGCQAFKHGTMRQRVLGLEAVLPDGEILSDLKRVSKANEGYDIKQLFIGAEGTLGIVTRIVLKLVPGQGNCSTALVCCENSLSAASLFQRLRHNPEGNLLNAELMWPNYARTTAEQLELADMLDIAESDSDIFVVLDVSSGDEKSSIDFLEQSLSGLLSEGLITNALIAQNERERNNIWKIRDESFLCDKRYPHGLWYDISVPLNCLDVYTGGLFENIAKIDPGLKIFLFGHLGDGNLHLTVSSGEKCPQLAPAINDAVYTGLDDVGGSFSAEHGIGIEKIASLKKYCDPAKMRLMTAIKQSFDPKGIMNPGKVLDL